MGLFSGTRPAGLGIHNGQLKPAPQTPNAVHSQVREGGAAIAPLAIVGSPATAIQRLTAQVAAMPGARVITVREDYLYAEFTSRWLGFVDDVEFWFDPAAGVIQVRSASRLGRRDFGVNRARIEAIRSTWRAQDEN